MFIKPTKSYLNIGQFFLKYSNKNQFQASFKDFNLIYFIALEVNRRTQCNKNHF